MSRVKTEAGAELHFYVVGLVGPGQALDRYLDNYIAAIEAEAVTAALAALRLRVEEMRADATAGEAKSAAPDIAVRWTVMGRVCDRVLTLIDEALP